MAAQAGWLVFLPHANSYSRILLPPKYRPWRWYCALGFKIWCHICKKQTHMWPQPSQIVVMHLMRKTIELQRNTLRPEMCHFTFSSLSVSVLCFFGIPGDDLANPLSGISKKNVCTHSPYSNGLYQYIQFRCSNACTDGYVKEHALIKW